MLCLNVMLFYLCIVFSGIFVELFYYCARSLDLTERYVDYELAKLSKYETFEFDFGNEFEEFFVHQENYQENYQDDKFCQDSNNFNEVKEQKMFSRFPSTKKELEELEKELENFLREYKQLCMNCIEGKNLDDDNDFFCSTSCPQTTDSTEMLQYVNALIRNTYIYKLRPFDLD